MFRYVIVWAAGSIIFAFSEVVDSILFDFAAVGAAVIGAGIVWGKVIRPGARIFKKLEAGLDVILGLPHRMDRVEERQERQAERLEGIEESITVPEAQLVTRQDVYLHDSRDPRARHPFDQGEPS